MYCPWTAGRKKTGDGAERPYDYLVKRFLFFGGLRPFPYLLRRGKPVKTWGPEVFLISDGVAESADALTAFMQPATPPAMWTAAVRPYFGIF